VSGEVINLATLDERLEDISEDAGRIRCSGLRCINHQLNRLDRNIENTAGLLDGLISCIGLRPTTRYSDFLSSDGTTTRTGLDRTAEGDTATFITVVWLC
jgi:hypothetical protein